MFNNPYLIPVHFAMICMLIGMGIFLFWIYKPLKKTSRAYIKARRKAIKFAKKLAKRQNYRKNPDYQI